jgi:hypothetical protein
VSGAPGQSVRYWGALQCAREMVVREGFASLYRGCAVNVLKVGPHLLHTSTHYWVRNTAAGRLPACCCPVHLSACPTFRLMYVPVLAAPQTAPGAAIQFVAYDLIKTSVALVDPTAGVQSPL